MTQDRIIKLAREAGIPVETDWAGRPSTLVLKDGSTYLRGIDDLERFAALVRTQALEEVADMVSACDPRATPKGIAAAIRALKGQP